MPAVSKKQFLHIEQINKLPQTIKNRFMKGHIPHNKKNSKYRYTSEGKRLSPIELCSRCKINYKTVYNGKFCRKCSYEIRKEKTGKRIWKNGYVYTKTGSKPKPEHIYIAESVLGRKMKKGEHVHHINMNKADNRNCNLLICNASYHKWLHHRYAQQFVRRILCPANQ